MKAIISIVTLVLGSCQIWAQDGKVIEKSPLVLSDSVFLALDKIEPGFSATLDGVNFYRITYLSDGLRVSGYVAEPDAEGKYPCIISNRGGNREYGKWSDVTIAYDLGSMASWGYVTIASQYRGNDGGEGREEFGGQEINDVMNLIPALAQFPKADTSRIGIWGAGRGGMMTYLALKRSCKFKAAAVGGGMA